MRYSIWTVLTCLGLAFVSANASAENAHTYNGSFCKSYIDSQSGDLQAGTYMQNNSSSTRYVVCPVVVDEISNTGGTSRVYAHVTGSGSFYCYLYSMNAGGSVRQFKSANRSNTGWIYLPDITTDDYYGSYSMICTLPGRGRLDTVWVAEKN